MKTTLVAILAITAMNVTVSSAADNVEARLAEVRRILREVPLIDGHNDVPWQYRRRSNDFSAIDLARDTSQLRPSLVTDIPRLRAGGVGGQFWSVYVPTKPAGAAAVQATIEQIDVVYWMCARYPETFELALTADDVERIHRTGRIASLIGMEGGHSINNSLGTLRMMYRLGARYMTLTHTSNTDWADAAGDEAKHGGLTAFGEEVVREMNRLGMLVDLSHVTDDTMRDALRVSKAPVIFSHSSARALCNHVRNVPDDVLRLTATNGGVVMVCFLPAYVVEVERKDDERRIVERKRLEQLHGADEEKVREGLAEWRRTNPDPNAASLTDVANHIDHIRKLVGVDYIGIGSDFDGYRGALRGLEDVSKYPDLFAELLRRGYTADELKKIAGLNVLRALRGAERVARELQANP
jgi:membrane dipeptidase